MKIYMETLGCPKNFNDTQVAKGIMVENGFELTDYIDEADVMILNMDPGSYVSLIHPFLHI